MSETQANDGRVGVWQRGIYLVRDVFEDGKFVRCEYATAPGGHFVMWTPCPEGVDYCDIEPLVKISDADLRYG